MIKIKYLIIIIVSSIVLSSCAGSKGSVSTPNSCPANVYVRYNGFHCARLCQNTLRRPVFEFQEIVMQEFLRDNDTYAVVSKAPTAYVNKVPSGEFSNSGILYNGRDHYNVGDIRRLYPGYMIADVQLQYLAGTAVGFSVQVIEPKAGKTVFVANKVSKDHDLRRGVIRPVVTQARNFIENYPCEQKYKKGSISKGSWEK
jgi:hypothetical protein